MQHLRGGGAEFKISESDTPQMALNQAKIYCANCGVSLANVTRLV